MLLDTDNLLLLCQSTGFSIGKYRCDMVGFPTEHLSGCPHLSQWDLTLLEQRLVTTWSRWTATIDTEGIDRTDFSNRDMVTCGEHTCRGGAASVSESSFLSAKQALLFPADVLSLPRSNAEKILQLVRSQGREICDSNNVYARPI